MEINTTSFILAVLAVTLLDLSNASISNVELDINGYLIYCPCMGRFGNQADHFLGAFSFSESLNRTLVLPPWVEYRYGEPRSVQVPFDTYFKVESLMQYHRVVPMRYFMDNLADAIWPVGSRISFCYMQRKGIEENSCNAKDGNPFGPFWDTFGIVFDKSEFYGPLNYDIQKEDMKKLWMQKYPPNEWPVLAFTGAPATFPVQSENVQLQKYLKWSDDIEDKAQNFVKEHLSGGAFIGIHLRNGADWVRACKHVADSPTLFSSAQCVGHQNQRGQLTHAMCMPTKVDIVKQLKRTIKKVKDVKYIFVASDANHMVEELGEALHHHDVAFRRLAAPDPHLDLAILARANYFVGNCVSSYTAFVKRERDTRNLPSAFWAFRMKKTRHEEL